MHEDLKNKQKSVSKEKHTTLLQEADKLNILPKF